MVLTPTDLTILATGNLTLDDDGKAEHFFFEWMGCWDGLAKVSGKVVGFK